MFRQSIVLIAFFSVSFLSVFGQADDYDAYVDSELSFILNGLMWGASPDGVVDNYRDIFQEEFRNEVDGMRDPLEIDEIRQQYNRRAERIADSLEQLDSATTGYEVSILGGEVVGQSGESIMTVREEDAILYYIFSNNQLFRIVVAYNSNDVLYYDFESFLDQVERRYGPADSTETEMTDIGVIYLARAIWEDQVTQLRIENRSNLFGTFIMVFTSIDLQDDVAARRGSNTGQAGGVEVSDLVRMISSSPSSASQDNTIVDQIIGEQTVVELRRQEEEEAAAAANNETVQDQEEEDPEEAAERRRRRRERRQRQQEAEEAQQVEEEGISIY